MDRIRAQGTLHERAIVAPAELPAAQKGSETAVIVPHAQEPAPRETARPVCGINGCTTWYDDPVVMEKHRRRQHGIGVANEYPPKERTAKTCEGVSL